MSACFQGFPEPPAGWTRCLLWVLCMFSGDLCPTRWGLLCKQLVVWSCPKGQLQRRQAGLDIGLGLWPWPCLMDKITLSITPPNFLQGPPTEGADNHPINSMHYESLVSKVQERIHTGEGTCAQLCQETPQKPTCRQTHALLMCGHILQIHNGRQVCISTPIFTHPC